MRYHLADMGSLPSHEQFYYSPYRSWTWELWQIISLILGLLLLCFLISICLSCFRSATYPVVGGGVMPGQVYV